MPEGDAAASAGYLIAAVVVTAAGLVGYAVSLMRRLVEGRARRAELLGQSRRSSER